MYKEFVEKYKSYLKNEYEKLNYKPNLTIVQVGNNEASNKYIKGKIKDGTELGVNVNLLKIDQITENELLNLIHNLNIDKNVDGIIVQLPLPKNISEETVKLAIDPKKDVDGFHPLSNMTPCTPLGIKKFLIYIAENNLYCNTTNKYSGKNAVVIGRSNIVGKPMAEILLGLNCTITIMHSKTNNNDFNRLLENADIIVSATGRINMINKTHRLKDSAIVIDVGINFNENGKLCGDCEKNLPVAVQTPVPGGVGLSTRLAIYDNLLNIVKEKIGE